MEMQDYLLCFDSGDDLAVETVYELIDAKSGDVPVIGTKDECFAWGVMRLRTLFGDAPMSDIVINAGQLRHPLDSSISWNQVHYFLWEQGKPYR